MECASTDLIQCLLKKVSVRGRDRGEVALHPSMHLQRLHKRAQVHRAELGLLPPNSTLDDDCARLPIEPAPFTRRECV